MSEEAVSERLRQARIERGESVATVAGRGGMRVELVQAIEEGRFQDLPSGIYGRAAIRRHSAALDLDADALLELCGPLLPAVEDPITAMGRLRGVPVSGWRPSATHPSLQGQCRTPRDVTPSPWPSWRLLSAAAIDASAMALMLLGVVTCTVAAGVPVSAMGNGAAIAFTTIALVLGGCYFVLLGGLFGATPGEYLAGLGSESKDPGPLDMRAVALRTLQSVLRDARFIEMFGQWTGRLIADPKLIRERLIPNP